MIPFQVGDEVRVEGVPASEWRGLRGIIVKVIDRPIDETGQAVQECAVQFSGSKRWFLADHLVRTLPDKWIRSFRGQAMDRWSELDRFDTARLNGDRDTLIALLQDRCGLARRRAEIESDDFMAGLQNHSASAA
jgi:hypothetical protein